MYCDRAIIAIKSLTDSGAVLTPEEVIRLNSYGVEMEKTPDDINVINAPRVAWLGDVPIFQPTIQSEIWYRDFACKWWYGESCFYALVWSCANSNEPKFFADKTNEKQCRKAIAKWYTSLNCIENDVIISTGYVTDSYDNATEEDEKELELVLSKSCPYTDVVNECLASGLGMTVAEIETQPHSRLLDILRRWAKNQIACNGGDAKGMDKSISTLAFVKYENYLEKLKDKYGNQ